MKKLLIGLPLVLAMVVVIVLVMSAPAWSAALTLTDEVQHITGGLRVITGTSAVNSGDTYAVSLNTIVYVGVAIRGTGVVSERHTISGSTITFYTDTDGKTWEFYIIGY